MAPEHEAPALCGPGEVVGMIVVVHNQITHMEVTMAELEKSFEYKGRQVQIYTYVIGKKWGWSYQIDGEATGAINESGCRSDDQAVAEATVDARYRVDHMK